jgi:murein biosynthesis integral membrane protein MurJ
VSEEAQDSLVRSSAVMASGTLVSRILGVVRASMLTALLGVSGALGYDAFSTANTVPTTLYNLVAGGLLNAVLVPQIVRAARHEDGGEDYLNRLLTLALVGLLAITALVVALSPLVPVVFASSHWDTSTVQLCVAFAFWCMPQVFFYGAYTMLGQVLNARGNFGPYMWAPVANNVVAIAGIGVLLVSIGGAGHHPRPPSQWTGGQIAMLGGTATLGVAVQAAVLVWPLRGLGIRYRPRFGWRGVGLRSAGRVAGWTFLAALVGQLGFIVISRVVTSAVVQGGAGRGAYDNAFLLFMLPHSLITVSLVTALFTRMSRAAAAGRQDDVRRDVSLGLRLTGVATVLATGAVLVLGLDIASTLFAGNTTRDTNAIAYTTMGMIVGVVPFSAQYLFQRAFYAYEDAFTPFLIQIPVVLTSSGCALIALGTLPPRWIVVGVGVGMSLGYGFGAVLSFLVLRRRIGGVEGRSIVRTYSRLVVACVLAAIPALVVTRGLHHLLGHSKPVGLLSLAAGGLVMLAGYVLVCRRMRVAEVDELTGPLLRRFGR